MLKIIMMTILAALLTLILATVFTPYPASYIIKKLFEGGLAVAPENYAAIQASTVHVKDVPYPSAFASNELDVISPKAVDHALPVIIWVHGGAFAAGDKSDITEYAVQLAAKGYHVVNMNYALAPANKYPTPLLQLNDVYAWVTAHAAAYNFDTSNIIFAGDSAGAQIVSQYAVIQTNADYAARVNMQPIVAYETIAGLLLFCGPYDIGQLNDLSDNKLVTFLLNRVGWGYIGERNWQNSEVAQLASPIDFATENYPPSFITDGNFMTFTDHGKAFAAKLNTLNVPVTEKFYEGTDLPHEYQFIMNTPAAFETFDAVTAFLAAQTTPKTPMP